MTGDVCCGSGRADAVAVACPWFWRCAMNASRLAGAGWTLGEGCVADDGCFFSASARAVGGAAMEAVGEAAGLSGRSGAVCVGAGCDAGDSNVAETGAEPVLDDINLKIKSGETVGILGGTGSSKTSLVNLIGRLYDVTSGEVLVGGRNVKEYDLEKLRDEVSVVLQSNVLFSGTILDNLRWGNENATEEECVNACKLACADDFIQTFPEKYNTFIERGGTNVSGGQKQRICIARALLKKPKILILDDSTSAVDTATDAKIRKAFAEEIPNTTKLIISQRISSVQNADKIIVLDNGKISGVGSHDELLNKNDIYTEIYEAQTKGSGDFDAKGEM